MVYKNRLRTMYMPQSNRSAFTIVELLVVIVVIGILAAITIVSYTGISNRATISSIQSDLTNASQQLKLFNVDNSVYPTTINCALPDSVTNKCLNSSNDTTYIYKSSPANHNIFCLEATKSSNTYNITQEGQLLAGPCPVLNLDAGSSLSYPGTGNDKWYDLSGLDNNGVLIGGVGYSPVNGGVMSFDGIDDTINTNSQPPIQISPNNFTISGYIKPDNLTSRFITPNSNGRDQYLGYDATNQRLYVTITELSDVNNRTRYAPTNSAPLNVWIYFSVTINDKNIKIFINGQLVSEYNETINIADWSSFWAIGSRGSGVNWYEGLIGEINVFNRELVDTEVLYNFNATKGRYGL